MYLTFYQIIYCQTTSHAEKIRDFDGLNKNLKKIEPMIFYKLLCKQTITLSSKKKFNCFYVYKAQPLTACYFPLNQLNLKRNPNSLKAKVRLPKSDVKSAIPL